MEVQWLEELDLLLGYRGVGELGVCQIVLRGHRDDQSLSKAEAWR